eukprot:TRINITY_DN10722_c0_g1_i1.p1 TRINITY_DN10722_c0_g1~~TRINITY_DN10722_c0_g1_i1.p1  ORF type:complete len:236 (-),score=34.22 TRINITY_DN10722_c0_g1_i1:99-806(-)
MDRARSRSASHYEPQPEQYPYERLHQDCICESTLRRKEKGGTWSDRYFVLYHNALFGFKSNKPPKPDATPNLVIPLGSIDSEFRHEIRNYISSIDEKPTIAIFSSGTTLLLQAPGNRATLDRWKEAVLAQALKVEGALLRTRSARKIHDQIARPSSQKITAILDEGRSRSNSAFSPKRKQAKKSHLPDLSKKERTRATSFKLYHKREHSRNHSSGSTVSFLETHDAALATERQVA